MANTPTIHNAARYGDIATSVLMCGDPLRAKYIAEKFLEMPSLYNSIRGMYGYTGLWKGKRISVQGHGMGGPSIGIYSYELFKFYGVEKIIRLGTCGAYGAGTAIGSLIIATKAITDSSYGYQFGKEFAGAETHAGSLIQEQAIAAATERGIPHRAGKVFSSDVFYDPTGSQKEIVTPDVLAAEMELHALYTNATALECQALGLLMVTDNIATGESLPSSDREKGYRQIIEMALDLL